MSIMWHGNFSIGPYCNFLKMEKFIITALCVKCNLKNNYRLSQIMFENVLVFADVSALFCPDL